MSVTLSPYGASLPGTSYICLLGNPHTGLLNSLSSRRHILRANSVNETLAFPDGYNTSHDVDLLGIDLPASLQAQGMYYCEASSRGLATRVPITILANNRKYKHSSYKCITLT